MNNPIVSVCCVTYNKLNCLQNRNCKKFLNQLIETN